MTVENTQEQSTGATLNAGFCAASGSLKLWASNAGTLKSIALS